jgi:mono/diheme cytochrome c family protein
MIGGKVQAGRIAALAAGALLAVTGCSEKTSSQASPGDGAAASAATRAGGEAAPALGVAEGGKLFANRCSPCHGAKGAGDGAASAGFNPRPRNFQDPAWQSEVSDEHIERIIVYGGAAVGRSPAMPPNPDFSDKPEVKALREFIRSLGK